MTMKLFTGIIPVLLLASGCYVRSRAPGTVTLLWSFNHGQTCARSGVDHLQLSVEGQVLDNGGQYPCLDTTHSPGVTLSAFDSGSYRFSLTALDASGNALYSRDGTFDVEGDTQLPVDLAPPAGSAPANVTWSYRDAAGAPLCGQDFDQVELDVDGTPFGSGSVYNCADGSFQGVLSPPLSAGSHTVTVRAFDSVAAGTVFASGAQNFLPGASAGGPVPLDWEVGGVAVTYNLTDSPTAPACIGSGLTATIDFEDVQTHQTLYGSGGTAVPACQVPVIFFLPTSPNPYQVQVQALGGGHAWAVPANSASAVKLEPGVFGDPANALFIPMAQLR